MTTYEFSAFKRGRNVGTVTEGVPTIILMCAWFNCIMMNKMLKSCRVLNSWQHGVLFNYTSVQKKEVTKLPKRKKGVKKDRVKDKEEGRKREKESVWEREREREVKRERERKREEKWEKASEKRERRRQREREREREGTRMRESKREKKRKRGGERETEIHM